MSSSPSTNYRPMSGKDARGPGKRDNRAATIKQDELRTIFSLRTLDALYKKLRADIVERLESGASVERGDFVVEFNQKESRTLTFERLVEVVGQVEAHRIRDEIEPTVSSYLMVKLR